MNIAPKKKHPQFILAVSAEWLRELDFGDGLKEYPIKQFYEEVNSHLVMREREQLEKDGTWRQLLPYTIVTRTGWDGVQRFLPYRRLSGGGEARLHDKVSVGFGGHVDIASLVMMSVQEGSKEASTPNLELTLAANSELEIGEELNILTASGGKHPWIPEVLSSNLFIHQNTDPEYVHLGMIQYASLDEDLEVVSGEDDNIELLPVQSAAEILATYPNIEAWSRVFLRFIAQAETATTAA